ncbi:tetratricopeptide repeat protein [Dyadobacter jejuensis]|uniref:Tetratricopeptide repeat protein n=1 Tax=Dyadobacter jejuensis TaxID=1082580 RepID=A0A316AQ66_9BACT|nr:tetratricopeptide repeat protein [Dyadobacter jejuensis]PWJ59274.1 tetratricopeptide repeat protein [Dyadobacter jejuensis]
MNKRTPSDYSFIWLLLACFWTGLRGYAQNFDDCNSGLKEILPLFNQSFEENNPALLRSVDYQKKLRQLKAHYNKYHQAQYNPSDSIARLNNEALLLALSGNFHKSYRILKGLDLSNQSDDLRYNRGLVAMLAGEYKRSREDLQKVPSRPHLDLNMLYGYGREQAYEAANNYAQSVNYGRKAAKWHYNKGLLAHLNGEKAEAVDELSLAIRSKDELAAYRLLRGDLYMDLNQEKSAVKDFEKVARRFHKAQIRYANSLLSLNEFSKAKEVFEAYIQSGHRGFRASAYLGLAHAFYGKNQLEMAMRYYRLAASSMRETPALLCGIANVHLAKHEYDFAFNLFDRALKLDDTYGMAYLGRAVSNYGRKRYQRAMDDFESGSDALDDNNPQQADLFVTKGYTAQQLGRLELAEKSFLTALALDPNRYEAMAGMSNNLIAQKQYSRAGQYLAKALGLEKNYSEMWSNYGNLLIHFDMFTKAYQVFRKAVTLKPENINAQNGWGVVLLEDDQLDKSMALFDSLLGERPDLPFLLNNHGIVQSYLGNRHEQKREVNLANIRYDGAFADFKNAMAAAPSRKLYNVNQGNVYKYWEQYDEAKLSYQNYQDKSALNNTAVMYAGRQMVKDARYYLGVAIQLDSLHRVFQYNMNVLLKGKQEEMMKLVASAGDDGPYSDIGIKYSRDGFVTIFLYDYTFDTLTFPGRHYMPLPPEHYREEYFIPEFDFKMEPYAPQEEESKSRKRTKYRSQKVKMPGKRASSGTRCPVFW